MKKSHRLVNTFEQDLNQLETPPHKSMMTNYEILIKTKNYLDKVFNQKLEICSIHTQTIQGMSVTDKKSLVLDEQRNLRSRTIDHFPLDFKIDSQLRSVGEKKIKVKNCSQTKLNQVETQGTQKTTRREKGNFKKPKFKK
ncbi:unnamed protein product (macronuclear) [Paramecium tetraurelia]|uniref:Uncharacterized protein n=1 Tax=Paramecium tetraurelia TaxID=5888 RepID=A0E7L6_PARTE|nr:uncharacterized protein GSPATT00024011001 [Paramecium tetraurelia]CAK91283.1 unnamed protein product [Paramecium tetraurelia]|eukprot:XP_001458680.1 hypothetical protein (macronuclear) [Paramecium tetraurelia strain d4-2]